MPPPTETALARIIRENDIAAAIGMPIVNAFLPHYEAAMKLAKDAEGVTVTDATQVSAIKKARALRLALREERVKSVAIKDREKAVYLRMSKAIQGIHNQILAIAEPVEARLQECEDFAERAEQARLVALRAERGTHLNALGLNADVYPLDTMSEEDWIALLESSRRAQAFKIEQDKTAREAAAAKEAQAIAERRRLSAENERLKKEADAQRQENEKAELKRQEERVRLERKARDEKTAADAIARKALEAEAVKLNAERQAREAVERELALKNKQEADAKAAADKAAKKAANAPDYDKLMAFAKALNDLPVPAVKSIEAAGIRDETIDRIGELVNWLRVQAKQL